MDGCIRPGHHRAELEEIEPFSQQPDPFLFE
jgi:hypothetical protein